MNTTDVFQQQVFASENSHLLKLKTPSEQKWEEIKFPAPHDT